MGIMNKLENFFIKLGEKGAGLSVWTLGFLGMIFFRCFTEQFLALAKPLAPYEVVVEYIHNFYFFSLAILLIWLFLSAILKENPQKLSGVLIYSLLFLTFPPLIDMIKTGGEAYWSFYLFSAPRDLLWQYATVFGHLPSAIVYFGTKIIFVATVAVLFFLVWFRTKNFLKSIFTAFAVYSILFFLGAFPSFFYYLYNFIFGTKKFLDIKAFEIFEFFGSLDKMAGIDFQNIKYAVAYRLDFIYYIALVSLLAILFYWMDKKKFIAVVKNFRYPQLFYHSGLLFIGLAVGAWNYQQNFKLDLFSLLAVAVLFISVWLAWKASVVVNDLNDFAIDAISNPERPLQQGIFSREEYANFGWACFILSILGGISIGFPFAVLLITYQVVAWVYSAQPFRLKKFPLIATFISSFALLLILFLGYILMSDNQTFHTLSPRIIFLMLIVGTISLSIKDFKDIAGDKKDNIWTIPVIFGEKKARLIVASGIFISFIASVFFLNELKLFWWAMFLGGLAFLSVASLKIKPRLIFWPVLGIIFVYGLVMVKILFF
ncbi:MAG: hypothetical protein A2271_03390 [Candidatus Moranbacteria bacterium RIFOXYA12_FULL_35_19]|nr:MAG: Homogentisate geranylgeranyl transferase [Candidatus Moranbacteria bacterium GW2011_GWF2_35_39]OGI32138.1 MAG: hypothetical protein A2343_00090 [Candidatus Moranbacteria bacterium RIFOXYB12_FULL_35_8]OGI33420.1 MAG: hypothetical protein A2489_03515 [Candidatus Moranbacteria bacterium RIFOXYC12_FULL_36_13]OGI36356.1 MAG: hypothetical protein A2271_03390 [Candidatus Moranbacteria bacterium RIFOXYA12_FULL_35_19]